VLAAVGADVKLAAFFVEALAHLRHAFVRVGWLGPPSTKLRLVPLPGPGRI